MYWFALCCRARTLDLLLRITSYELAVGGRASRSTTLSKAAYHKVLIMKRLDGKFKTEQTTHKSHIACGDRCATTNTREWHRENG